ncbi:MAG: PHP domain-containing protein [Mycoplasma sp.]
MKIDLHLHSFASESNGDSIKFFSIYDTLVKIMNSNVKMAAFTDHNTFDVNLYIEARKLAKTGNITLLPGIEVNVIRLNGEIGHMLILFNNNLDENKLNKISQIAKEKIWKNGVSIHKINNLFDEYETIRIIHIGKGDFFKWDDLENLNYDAFEITNRNHPNFKSVMKHGYKSSIVSFSDTHMWDNYPQLKQYETTIDDLENATFEELKNALSLNIDYVKERI